MLLYLKTTSRKNNPRFLNEIRTRCVYNNAEEGKMIVRSSSQTNENVNTK